jgi:hypothetical protein
MVWGQHGSYEESTSDSVKSCGQRRAGAYGSESSRLPEANGCSPKVYSPLHLFTENPYDATGIVTAARAYRAGRAVVFTVRPLPTTRRIKKIYCRSNENVLVAMMNLIYS